MKTIEEVQKQKNIGDVFTNGNKKTSISVWNINLFNEQYDKYPYVCWYNK